MRNDSLKLIASTTSKLILDGVDYYQVVFTLPNILSTMALANQQEIAELLFHSAWKALKKTVESQQRYELGALMVLHTWNQMLEPHWHVHTLVPGAGPSLDDGTWTEAKAPQVAGQDDNRKYLQMLCNVAKHLVARLPHCFVACFHFGDAISHAFNGRTPAI